MKEFFSKYKILLAFILITLFVFAAGIFLLSKDRSTEVSTNVVNSSLLLPQNAFVTSGYSNGTYMPSSPSASVTLVEFGDYQCPACGVYDTFIKQLLINFSGKMNFVFRNYPISQHKNAYISSYAVEAAGLQGKYWQMHEQVYATQAAWSNLADPTDVFIGYAKDLNLDIEQFTSDLESPAVKDKVQNDKTDGDTIGITETPTFYLNGKKINLEGTYNQLEVLIDSALSND